MERFSVLVTAALLFLGLFSPFTETIRAADSDWSWHLKAEGDAMAQHFTISGPLSIEEGLLKRPTAGSGGGAIDYPYRLADFELRVRFMVHGYGTYGAMTIRLREGTPGESYEIRLYEYGVLARRRDGAAVDFRTLAQTGPVVPLNAWHEMRVRAEGNRFSVWIDDALRMEFVDPDARYDAGGLYINMNNISISIGSLELMATEAPVRLASREVELPLDRPLPPAGRITGTFLSLDASNLLRSNSFWNAEFNAMQEIGMDTLIVRRQVAETGAIFPVTRTLLDQAERIGMKVYLGIPGFGGYDWSAASQEQIEREVERAKAAIDAVADQYGEHPAFAGWYLENEIDEKDLVGSRYTVTARYYGELTAYAHAKTPGRPVIAAPSFSSATSPEWYAARWKQLLLETGIDILAVQDSVGQLRTVPELNPAYFAALRRATDEVGATLWADVEIFDQRTWTPAPVELVHRQLQAVADYVEKTVVFEFHRYMSPLHNLQAGELYRGYQRLLER